MSTKKNNGSPKSQSNKPNPKDEELDNPNLNPDEETQEDETEEEDDLDEGINAGSGEPSEKEQPEMFKWPELLPATKGFALNGKDPKCFHVTLHQGGFDPETGKPLHKPHPSIHNPMDFKQLLGNALGLGYKKININHVPQGYENFRTEWQKPVKERGRVSF